MSPPRLLAESVSMGNDEIRQRAAGAHERLRSVDVIGDTVTRPADPQKTWQIDSGADCWVPLCDA